MNDYLDENIGCLGVIGIWAIVIAIIFIEPFITFGFACAGFATVENDV